MSELIIRAPRPEDVPAITEMMNLPGVRSGTLRLPHTREDFVKKRFNDTAPNVHSLIAELDGTPVGTGTLVHRLGRQSHAGDVFLLVHDDYWNRGIGSRLMTELLELADNWLGLRRLQLEVNVDNPFAVRLYEKFGFEREGMLRGQSIRDGELVDCFVMGRLRAALSRRTEESET